MPILKHTGLLKLWTKETKRSDKYQCYKTKSRDWIFGSKEIGLNLNQLGFQGICRTFNL